MRPALFLDRDGVINIEKSYVHQIEKFEFMPGIFELCRAAMARGYLLIVITNQAGIGRGYYSKNAFEKLTAWMAAKFLAQGVIIDKIYHCPHHPDAGVGEYKVACSHRKPNPGMILQAVEDFSIDLENSVLIGNEKTDIAAAANAGVTTKILLGGEKFDDTLVGEFLVADNLSQVTDLLFD